MNGYRLAEQRREHDMSQEQLGKFLKVSAHTISSYERGKTSPSDEDKVIIAKLFDVSLDYLLGLVDVPRSYRREKFPIKLPRRVSEDDLRKIQEYVDYVLTAKVK
jgi:transcriptional regulator with XRE-family HTH domain